MFWVIPTWALSCLLMFLSGYHLGNLRRRIEYLEKTVKTRIEEQPRPEEIKSTLIDPDDQVQTAIYEHEKMMEKLNPK